MTAKKAQLRSLCTSCQEVEETRSASDMGGVGVISLVRGAGTTEAAAQGLPTPEQLRCALGLRRERLAGDAAFDLDGGVHQVLKEDEMCRSCACRQS